MSATTTAVIETISLTPTAGSSNLLALAEAVVVLDGVPVTICGIQVRGSGSGSSIHLPCYRAPGGDWRAAVILPDELKDALGDLIQREAIAQGILKVRYPSPEN